MRHLHDVRHQLFLAVATNCDFGSGASNPAPGEAIRAREWARGQGCVEFASDTEERNVASADAHRALGFTDLGLVRCFRKDL